MSWELCKTRADYYHNCYTCALLRRMYCVAHGLSKVWCGRPKGKRISQKVSTRVFLYFNTYEYVQIYNCEKCYVFKLAKNITFTYGLLQISIFSVVNSKLWN